jgi:methylated-DNA-protein-cysteine methyltransferase related protein
MTPDRRHPTYERVYEVVSMIPTGKVATYGQISSIVGNCTARMVGYALAALPQDYDVPWHRVINAQARISPRAHSESTALQRELLENEGIRFSSTGRVDFGIVRWGGPPLEWLLAHGYDPAPSWREV